jgi:hypothetical protein
MIQFRRDGRGVMGNEWGSIFLFGYDWMVMMEIQLLPEGSSVLDPLLSALCPDNVGLGLRLVKSLFHCLRTVFVTVTISLPPLVDALR